MAFTIVHECVYGCGTFDLSEIRVEGWVDFLCPKCGRPLTARTVRVDTENRVGSAL